MAEKYKHINDAYEELISPEYFVTLFADMEHFKEWCRGGDVESLKCMLQTYEDAEMYEYCAVIFEVINSDC